MWFSTAWTQGRITVCSSSGWSSPMSYRRRKTATIESLAYPDRRTKCFGPRRILLTSSGLALWKDTFSFIAPCMARKSSSSSWVNLNSKIDKSKAKSIGNYPTKPFPTLGLTELRYFRRATCLFKPCMSSRPLMHSFAVYIVSSPWICSMGPLCAFSPRGSPTSVRKSGAWVARKVLDDLSIAN